MRHICGILCTSFFLVSLTAGQAQDKEAKAQTITEKENGTKVKLAKGETLTIKLEGVPTAGYVWNIAKNNADQLAPQGKPEVTPAKKGVIGGKAITTFRFKADAAGASDLELHYKRPFEKNKEPAKTFKITVEIK